MIHCGSPSARAPAQRAISPAMSRSWPRQTIWWPAPLRCCARRPLGQTWRWRSSCIKRFRRRAAWAARLGSDTPCLVYGGTTRIAGRGEIVEPLPDAEPLWLALAKPPVNVSTASVFRALTPAEYGDAADTEAIVAAIRAGQPLPFERLTNTLERSVLAAYPDVLRTRQQLLEMGAPLVLMSGSGPSLFAPFRSLAPAAALFQRASANGLTIWLCHSVTRAHVVASRS